MNNFVEVIRILGKGGLDFKAIALKIAEKDPKAFVDAFYSLNETFEMKVIRELDKFSNKIDAIKCVRNALSLGLMEAKVFVEKNCKKFEVRNPD